MRGIMPYIYAQDVGSSRDHAAGILLHRHRYFQDGAAYTGRGKVGINKNVVHEKHIVYASRLPLQTGYSEIEDDIEALMNEPDLAGNCHLVVDRGEAGGPVIESLGLRGLLPIGIRATNGNEPSLFTHGNGWNVPKRDLVQAVKIELTHNRLMAVPGIDHEKQINHELLHFRQFINKRTGNDSYEALRESDHDDLVMAIAMAVWVSRKVWPLTTQDHDEVDPHEDYNALNHGLIA